jgi:hypothetical protein
MGIKQNVMDFETSLVELIKDFEKSNEIMITEIALDREYNPESPIDSKLEAKAIFLCPYSINE